MTYKKFDYVIKALKMDFCPSETSSAGSHHTMAPY